jgi:signal transduction histidine kinase
MFSLSEAQKEAYHRSGTLYGAFAFASVVLSCFSGYLFTDRFFSGAEMVPYSFLLGAVYVVIGILSNDFIGCAAPRWRFALYYLAQSAVLTVLVFISPTRGFFGMIVLPLVSQAVFDLRRRYAAALVAYLFAMSVSVWGFDFGWKAAAEAAYNYAAGFAFTIAFSMITRQALNSREREEKLRREIEAANEQLRAYAAQAEELATTRERNRVAREIHDGVGHYLTVVKTQLDAAAALIPTRPDDAAAAVRKAAKLTADALDDVRRSVGALRTDTPRPPLPDALRDLVTHGEPVPTLTIEGAPRPLPPGIEHALFRAAQEGLTNIRKHARATNALVRLDFRAPARIVLELADNGVGANGNPDGGFGLQGLRERIEVLGGTFEAANRLEGGFALRVEVPA